MSLRLATPFVVLSLLAGGCAGTRTQPQPTAPAPSSRQQPAAAARTTTTAPAPARPPAPPAPPPPVVVREPVVRESATRTPGLNYVVVQSYTEEKQAKAAVDVLAKNDIQATIERGLPGWAGPQWFTVVGTRGFERMGDNPDYDAYRKRILEIGAAQQAATPGFKKFEAHPYKWK